MTAMTRFAIFLGFLLTSTLQAEDAALEPVVVAPDHTGFVGQNSGKAFTPWGVNYGNAGRLMEDFWDTDWSTLENDLHKIKELGANVVRVHLQFAMFMQSATHPKEGSLNHLRELVSLAEKTGLYLDLTGLACYRTKDVPAWYDAMDEKARWSAQCVFWRAIAGVCRGSNSIFCYDLMNEPMVPGGDDAKWYSGKPLGDYDFLQSVSRTLSGRKRPDLANQWIDTLTTAIREVDPKHMVTVGMLPWVTGWGHLFGFIPKEVAPHVDFLSIHLYPDTKKPDEVRKALSECAGHHKPVVIEETFPLSCSVEDLEVFLRESRATACGWVWHYDGSTPHDYEQRAKEGKGGKTDFLWRAALQSFVRLKHEMIKPE